MAKAKLPVIIELGKCPWCHVTILTVPKPNQPVRSEKYREFWVELSDGSRMKVAVCADCRELLDKTMVEALMAKHREFWVKGIKKAYQEQLRKMRKNQAEQEDHFNNMKALRFAKTEKALES